MDSTSKLPARASRGAYGIVAIGVAAVVFALAIAGAFVPGARDRLARLIRGVEAKPLVAKASTIAPGFHSLGQLDPSAAYVVESSSGLLLFDTGLDPRARSLLAQLRALGLDPKKIRAIFLTHVHGDHTGGAEFLRETTGARVFAGRGDADVLRAGNSRDAFFSTYHMPKDVPRPTSVDVELKGGETFDFGDVKVEAIAAPGHTPGSVCYLVKRQGIQALVAGDVIMGLTSDPSVPSKFRKPLGTYSTYLPPRYRGNAVDYLATLKMLRGLPAPDLILPGHPRKDPSPQNPVVSRSRWEALIDEGIRDMETLVSRLETDGADFLDGRPIALLPDLYYFGDFGGSAVYGVDAQSQFFIFDAPGGPGLIDFLNDARRALGLKPEKPFAVLLTGCEPENTAGLTELVAGTDAIVVAPAFGIDRVRALCPSNATVISSDELASRSWFDAAVIPLKGLGIAPIAYRLKWANKNVLISGRIPIKPNHAALARLHAELALSVESARDYARSVLQLEPIRPDLWLPANPTDGQNANLYDRDWQEIIDADLRFFELNPALLGKALSNHHAPISPRSAWKETS